MSRLPNPPDGLLLHSFAGDDPIDCKDSICSRLKWQRGNLPIRIFGIREPAKSAIGCAPAKSLTQRRGSLKNSQETAGFLSKRARKLNGPPEGKPWAWLTAEMLESDAFRTLSHHALQALFRIVVEHCHQGGLENGRLKVTWGNFQKWGIHRRHIKAAIDEVIAAGFVLNTMPGRRLCGADRGAPAQYALTWLPIIEPDNLIPASNAWRTAPLKKRK